MFWIERLDVQAKMFGFSTTSAFEPTRWVYQGDKVSVGNETLSVRHCPGHTPGHVVYESSAANLCFVGDVLFAGSIGRTDFPMGDHQRLLESIKRELMTLPNNMCFIPGHGPMSTIGEQRNNNPFLQAIK
jgi:glyoxylase-like metal-dependent hydrolase (beta-lactamase superfamily II)